MTTFARNDTVSHPRFGEGTVIEDGGETVIVRFAGGIQECVKSELTARQALHASLDEWHEPSWVIARGMAKSIEAVNDMWGVFSRSRIALLPHQLWVCHQVLRNWPTRWLVADDVGLGKTIEAGLIMWPLLSKKTVTRMLILCPASLVSQWQQRLREMFDIRLNTYSSEQDTERADYWNTNNLVVASLHTLRDDHNNRHARLLSSEPWDLVIVDEAHHLNYEEQSGATLAFELLEKLESNNRVKGMIFFTGTPHKGKDFNFVSLLGLLRRDLFPDAKRPLLEYLPDVPKVLIRNNKYSVTNLAGEKLFQPPLVNTRTYAFSSEEAKFYEMMTNFILTGKTYASTLQTADARTATLVLITLQKLASSSIAAVRSALQKRLENLRSATSALQDQRSLQKLNQAEIDGNEDNVAAFEELIAGQALGVSLMRDEQERIEELLQAASQVHRETKIDHIINLVQEEFSGRSVLFFTEYKATQLMLIERLNEAFGHDSTTFINGDESLTRRDGTVLRSRRDVAAEDFNSGKVRFLVSTEAAGEGVDLQGNCHTLIHVDLPWNPMRLHQRVGRINRYGQKHRVEVVSLRNPETVESRIWEKLNDKLERIQIALDGAMEEPEDLLQLVLGMASPSLFTDLFSNAVTVEKDSLSNWFDEATGSLGGTTALEAVQQLVGNSSKFDYSSVVPQIPKLDLPDLEPFFRLMLDINKRRVSTTPTGLSFITPDAWRDEFGIRDRYENLVFSREIPGRDANQRILGVGHKLVDRSLDQAKSLEVSKARFPGGALLGTTVLFRIQNRVTTDEAPVRATYCGLRKAGGTWEYLKTEDVYRQLVDSLKQYEREPLPAIQPERTEVANVLMDAQDWMSQNIAALDLPFRFPVVHVDSLLWAG